LGEKIEKDQAIPQGVGQIGLSIPHSSYHILAKKNRDLPDDDEVGAYHKGSSPRRTTYLSTISMLSKWRKKIGN